MTTRDKALKASFSKIKEELDMHLDSINANTEELNANFEHIAKVDQKIDKLNERIDELHLILSSIAGGNTNNYDKSMFENIKLSSREQEVFLSDFPLLTERGTFIVNGVERIVISQLIRSPGSFFTFNISRGKRLFGAKIKV